MAITPGEPEQAPGDRPLLAQEPLPPGAAERAAQVEELDRAMRESGPDEIEEADTKADAVEDGSDDGEPGGTSDADSDADPTTDDPSSDKPA
jgi:hypothetical protein